MDAPRQLTSLLAREEPLLALAPMQDVTDLGFWRVMARYGGPDVYFTEYFRVYPGSHLSREILRSILENPTGKPVVAQLIGNDIPALLKAARELHAFPVAGIDLNLGCPAPVVFRKCAGGGLLKHLDQVDRILGALREVVQLPLSVKTRLGFESADGFADLLGVFRRHALDLVTVHGRTVREMYRSPVDYDRIGQAAAALQCPVLANGNVSSAAKADEVLRLTNCHGVMIGRGAIRNPWIFRQIRQRRNGQAVSLPRGRDVLDYVHTLCQWTRPAGIRESAFVQKMKKSLNYLGLGIEPTGEFLHRMRRVTTEVELFQVCEDHLNHDRPMPLEPFPLPLKDADLLAGPHA